MKVNKNGCAPTEDVCMAHHRPLDCRHGCIEAEPHKCSSDGWTPLKDVRGFEIVRGTGPDPRRQLP